MKRIILLTMIFVLAFASMAYARTYKIGVVPWVGWSAAHVADAKGFWKEQGIDVKVFNFPSNMAVHTALKNKRIDIGFDMLGTAVGLYLEDLPVVIIAETDWSHGGDKIIVKKDLNAADLKGKPVGVYLDQPSVGYFLNHYLSTIGLKISDVRMVEMETSVLADKFIAGLFNVIVSYDPDALRAEREGNGRVVVTSASYEGCIPEGMLVLQDNLETIPKEDLTKIFRGWVKAAEWSQDPANWKEYMEILNTHTFKEDDPYSEQDLQEMVAAVRIHNATALLERNQNYGGLQTYLENLKAFLASNNMLTRDFEPGEIFDNTTIVEVLDNYK
jgi:NitT/TauT family transport system substrate-binding protein